MSGSCKFKDEVNKTALSYPFIDIPINSFTDNNINTVQELFIKYTYLMKI